MLSLTLLPHRYTVCRFAPEAPIPTEMMRGDLFCIIRTPDELSIVCSESDAPTPEVVERGWRVLKLEGPFPFEMTGVLVSVLNPLAEAGVSIFALSTYDTDYVLIKEEKLDEAVAVLTRAGHQLRL